MKVVLENNKYSLEKFLREENIRQGVVTLSAKYGGDSDFFLYKIKEKNGATSILHIPLFRGDNGNVELYDNDNMTFLLSIDYNNKKVIYEQSYMMLKMEEELNFLEKEYQVWETEILSKKAREDYKKTLLNKVKENLVILKKDEQFIDLYNKYLEEYKARTLNEYLDNPNMGEYEIYIRSLYRNILLNGESLEELQDYLILPSYISKLVEKNYEGDVSLDEIAEITAKNTILENLKNNPTPFIKFSLKIREAIKEGGKTLNITTKDGNTEKVENELYDGKEFRTIVGWKYIKIEDIEEITFNRKVLFSTKE